jgi:Cft2 family RNA processing exonuclease
LQEILYDGTTHNIVAKIELLSLGGAREIGANSYFLRFGSTGVLIDAGLHPEQTGWDAFPKVDLLTPGDVDTLIITHAHNDHLGALPYVLQSQPQAKVYATRETIDLATIMLANTASLFPKQHPQYVIDELVNYQEEKLGQVIDSIHPAAFGKPFMIGEDLRVTLTMSGHILGTAGILFEYQGKRLFHTSDIKIHNQHITAGAVLPEGHVDIIITETTNGAPDEFLQHTRAQEYERFCETLSEVLHGGGSVLIPSFALGKMQEMLVMMWDAMHAGKIPYVPIYTGGMGRRISDVYDAYRMSRSRCDTETVIADIPQEDLPRRDGLFGGKFFKQPSIVLAASGMMQEGTASYLLAQRWLRHEQFAICFIGYTDPFSMQSEENG